MQKILLVLFLLLLTTPTQAETTLGLSSLTLAGVNVDSGKGLPIGGIVEMTTSTKFARRYSILAGVGAQTGFGAFEPNPQVRAGINCLVLKPAENHVGVALTLNGVWRLRPGYGSKKLSHQIISLIGVALVRPGQTTILLSTGPAKILGVPKSTIWGFSIGVGIPIAKF